MMRRSGFVAIARAVNALFFLLTSAYCLLSYTPFAYNHFIKPRLMPSLTEFVVLHHVRYWLFFFITLLTLVPALRAPSRGRAIAMAYAIVWSAAGVWLVINPLMPLVDNRPRSLTIGLLALVPPIWLAIFDHVAVRPRLDPSASDERRALRVCLVTGVIVWAAYAVAIPFRLRQAVGLDLSFGAMLMGLGSSAVAHVVVFTVVFLMLAAIVSSAALTPAPASTEYALLVAVAVMALTLILHGTVFGSIAFTGPPAWLASAALALTLALVWSGVACWRAADAASGATFGPLDLFLAPITTARSWQAALVLLALPALGAVLVTSAAKFDWNFLVQKLGVLVVWLIAFGCIWASLPAPGGPRGRLTAVAAPLLILALYLSATAVVARVAGWTGNPRLEPEFVLDRYAALDESFHLIRDGLRTNSGETAAFYAYLKANSTISHVEVPPIDVDFVRPLRPVAVRKPHIFLFIIDSMRRDYLSPYNPKVTFTPSIASLARDSYVFTRAFTRYGGTALAVPSIWAGGMVLHKNYVLPFEPMNTLAKLVEGDGYRRAMAMDHIAKELFRDDRPPELPLERGVLTMNFEVCRTVDDLEAVLARNDGDPRPVFAYALPQNVHMGNSFQRRVPSGESYPGFYAPVASTVHVVDGCLGRFVDFLKQSGLYDDSIIILTSDHGDSLGEEGRWGHAYTVFPEVMRIPLIVHLPTRMRSRVTADLSRLTFSTDIAPSLYALLGYAPADLGPFYGRPLFVAPGTDLSARRRGSYLLASSYGAVYGMLRHNGRKLYIADAIDGTDYAYDLSRGGLGERVAITGALRAENWKLIRDQIAAIAREYHFVRKP